jgi:hypothetical protein
LQCVGAPLPQLHSSPSRGAPTHCTPRSHSAGKPWRRSCQLKPHARVSPDESVSGAGTRARGVARSTAGERAGQHGGVAGYPP